VSDRGINALRYVDPKLADMVLSQVIPMTGRMIHDIQGNLQSQKYGLNGVEAINSIDRSYLNELLLNEVEKQGIKLKFNHKLEKIQMIQTKKSSMKLFFNNDETLEFDLVIGADGSFSKVRQNLQKLIRMDYQQEYINCAYLELSIPANTNSNTQDRFQLDKNHLHIWPRDQFMLIALPNLDGSFTSTFFAPWEIIESLNTDSIILDFFHKNFKDAINLIGEDKLIYAFKHHPKGKLLSLNCNPYHYQDKVIIIGDAAHSMVPFYGQGMNCGFEDVFVLLKLLESKDCVADALKEYSQTRHDDLVSIIELAKENYKEMSHKVNSKLFLFKKQLDFLLTRLLKDRWLPLYTMISFRSDISYSKAVKIHSRQARILKCIQNFVIGGVFLGAVKLYRHLKRN